MKRGCTDEEPFVGRTLQTGQGVAEATFAGDEETGVMAGAAAMVRLANKVARTFLSAHKEGQTGMSATP